MWRADESSVGVARWLCRASPSSPCSFATVVILIGETVPRAEELASVLYFFAGALAPVIEASGLPHLKLVTQGRQT